MPEAEIGHLHYDPKYLADILKSVKTIAMVGASADKTKFSYGVLRQLSEIMIYCPSIEIQTSKRSGAESLSLS